MKINIGFVIPNIKNIPIMHILNIYNYIKKNELFNPILLSLKKDISKYINKYNVLIVDQKFNINNLSLNYIFFGTPYIDHYKTYFDINKLSKNIKIIYVSYGFNTWGTINKIVFNYAFFSNVYMTFHETELNKKDFIDFITSSKLKFFNKDNSYVSGCPKITNQYYNYYSPIKEKNNFRILYNTRWTNDEGNTFFIFFESIQKILELYQNIIIVYRPHPLTNNEILKHVNNFKNNRFFIISNDDYDEDFKNTDILISDASSLMTEFLSTGKPIIYTHKNNVFNSISKKFEEGYYKVTTKTELLNIINELVIKKNDYKSEIRKDFVEKYFKIYNPCQIITETLLLDYKKTKINSK
jgi:hypothetical protein